MEKVQDKYSWKLTDLFESREDFYKAIKEMKSDLKQIETYQGNLCESSEKIISMLSFIRNIINEI